jgi:hypothetical protein
LDPETAWVGQRVVLEIQVLSDQGWAQISRFGEVTLTDAYLQRPSGQGARLQEKIEGTDYSGQGYELSIYPQAEGTLRIPGIPIAVSVRAYGADVGQQVEQRETPPETVAVRTPPDAEGITGLISTSDLSAEQQWQSVPDEPNR